MAGAEFDPVLMAFVEQVDWCDQLGSPFTARFLERAAADIVAGGVLAELLGRWPGNPRSDAIALRFAGAVHALALAEPDSPIGMLYPPNAARGDDPALAGAVSEAIRDRPEHFRLYLSVPPQTNEVRRSAILLGGFLEIARRTRRPFNLLEIGASAGLNQSWDWYRYRLGDAAWGDASSPVVIPTDWSGPPPPLDARVIVASRDACDASPLDLDDPAQRLRLRSYVWADQAERLARLDAAIALSRNAGVRVYRQDAAEFLADHLDPRPADHVTVVYHTVVWQYLPAEKQQRIVSMLHDSGSRRADEAPLAWLRVEHAPTGTYDLRLTLWPDGAEEVLAHAHPHGAAVEWLHAPP